MPALNTNEAACVYAALILQDEGLDITAEKISALIEAANVEVEAIWPTIFAKALAKVDVAGLLANIGAGSAPAAAAAAAPASPGKGKGPGSPGKGAKKEAPKKEEKEESDDDMGFGLFD